MEKNRSMTAEDEKTIKKLISDLGSLVIKTQDDFRWIEKFIEDWCTKVEYSHADQKEKLLSYQLYVIFLKIESAYGLLRWHIVKRREDLVKIKSAEELMAYEWSQWINFDFPIEKVSMFDPFLVRLMAPLQELEDLIPLIKERFDDEQSLRFEIIWTFLKQRLAHLCFIIAKIQALQSEWRIRDL